MYGGGEDEDDGEGPGEDPEQDPNAGRFVRYQFTSQVFYSSMSPEINATERLRRVNLNTKTL